MDASLAYLLNFLEDEFRGYPQVRVRVSPKTGIERSPDLVQDYDPENNDLHIRRGVHVHTGRKEYYFPAEWARDRDYHKIQEQIEEVLERVRER